MFPRWAPEISARWVSFSTGGKGGFLLPQLKPVSKAKNINANDAFKKRLPLNSVLLSMVFNLCLIYKTYCRRF
jgi:hypothetical protein